MLNFHHVTRNEYLSNEKAEKDKTDCITEDSKGSATYQKAAEGGPVTPWCPGI
jgi:hypothetical protein